MFLLTRKDTDDNGPIITDIYGYSENENILIQQRNKLVQNSINNIEELKLRKKKERRLIKKFIKENFEDIYKCGKHTATIKCANHSKKNKESVINFLADNPTWVRDFLENNNCPIYSQDVHNVDYMIPLEKEDFLITEIHEIF